MMHRLWVTMLFVVTAPVLSVDLTVYPSGFWVVPEDTNQTLILGLSFNESHPFDDILSQSGSWTVKIVPDDDWKLDLVNDTVHFTAAEMMESVNKSVVFSGYYWLRTRLRFYLVEGDGDDHLGISDSSIKSTLLRDDIVIGVTRGQSIVDSIFMTLITVFLLANTINMGCQLNLQIILECLRRPLGPLCGFLSQFLIMPLFSYGVGYMLFENPLYRLGLFTLGCSPGGVMSNFWTLIFDGDLNLSITMTFVSTICALGMMPLWMFTLGQSIFADDNNLRIPFSNLAISLVGLTIPLSIGYFIQKRLPVWSDRLTRIIKPFTLGFLLVFLTIGTYNNFKAYLHMNWQMFVAGFLVATSGFLCGALFAVSFCLSSEQIIAISIETALQNVGVAFVVLRLSLPSPEGEIGSLPVMAQAVLTGLGLNTSYWIWTLGKRFCCRSSVQKDEKDATKTCPEKDLESEHALLQSGVTDEGLIFKNENAKDEIFNRHVRSSKINLPPNFTEAENLLHEEVANYFSGEIGNIQADDENVNYLRQRPDIVE